MTARYTFIIALLLAAGDVGRALLFPSLPVTTPSASLRYRRSRRSGLVDAADAVDAIVACAVIDPHTDDDRATQKQRRRRRRRNEVDEASGGNRRSDRIRVGGRRRWMRRAATVIVVLGMDRWGGATAVAVAAPTALVALLGWHLQSQRPREEDSVGNNDGGITDVSPEMVSGEIPSVQSTSKRIGDAWVAHRLREAEEREEAEEAARKAEQIAREAKRREKAQEWASATLRSTDEALRMAEEERRREAEAQRRAKAWIENAAKRNGLNLGD